MSNALGGTCSACGQFSPVAKALHLGSRHGSAQSEKSHFDHNHDARPSRVARMPGAPRVLRKEESLPQARALPSPSRSPGLSGSTSLLNYKRPRTCVHQRVEVQSENACGLQYRRRAATASTCTDPPGPLVHTSTQTPLNLPSAETRLRVRRNSLAAGPAKTATRCKTTRRRPKSPPSSSPLR